MTKFLLPLIFPFATLSLYAQNTDKTEALEFNTGGSAINIAISKFNQTEGNTFFDEAEEQEHKGNFNEALTLFGKAAFEYNAIKNFNKYGQAIMKMSLMHYQLGRFTDAEQILLNVALKNYSKLGNKTGLMNTYYQLGKIYLASNKFTQSLWFYTQQGILAQQQKNSFSYIESVIGIANVKIKKKDFTLATRDLNRAEFLANAIKSSQYISQIKDARTLIAGRVTAKK